VAESAYNWSFARGSLPRAVIGCECRPAATVAPLAHVAAARSYTLSTDNNKALSRAAWLKAGTGLLLHASAYTIASRQTARINESQASPPAWPRPPARPRTTRRWFYDRVRTVSVQMKDGESPRLARPPEDAWKQTRPRSREVVALALSALRTFFRSQRLSAGLGVARGSRECKIFAATPSRRRSAPLDSHTVKKKVRAL
jgi:hypothetical protein